jgi:hypothetical protein
VSAKTVVVPELCAPNTYRDKHFFVPDIIGTKVFCPRQMGQNSFVPGTDFCPRDRVSRVRPCISLERGSSLVVGLSSSLLFRQRRRRRHLPTLFCHCVVKMTLRHMRGALLLKRGMRGSTRGTGTLLLKRGRRGSWRGALLLKRGIRGLPGGRTRRQTSDEQGRGGGGCHIQQSTKNWQR